MRPAAGRCVSSGRCFYGSCHSSKVWHQRLFITAEAAFSAAGPADRSSSTRGPEDCKRLSKKRTMTVPNWCRMRCFVPFQWLLLIVHWEAGVFRFFVWHLQES